jgi:hypothetical protein
MYDALDEIDALKARMQKAEADRDALRTAGLVVFDSLMGIAPLSDEQYHALEAFGAVLDETQVMGGILLRMPSRESSGY